VSIEATQLPAWLLAAVQYRGHDWTDTLPLPAGRKYPPPGGHTGYAGRTPDDTDLARWAVDGSLGNLALRLPPGIVGIDVDAYGDKAGARTITEREREWGKLPLTWRTTSRWPDDGDSGIRLFQAPPGLAWDNPGPGVEVIHTGWRYAVCWPSIHDTGRTYCWIDEDSGMVQAGPLEVRPRDLPMLPHAWVEGLTQGRAAVERAKGQAGDMPAEWLHDGPCMRVFRAEAAGRAILAGAEGGRHDGMLKAVLAIVGYAARGHQGAHVALGSLRAQYVEVVGADRGGAGGEYDRMVHGAVAVLRGQPPELEWCGGHDCAPGMVRPLPDELVALAAVGAPPMAPAATTVAAVAGEVGLEPVTLLERELERQRATREARRLLDAEDFTRDFRTPASTLSLVEELAIPDEPVTWRIDEVFPTGANVLLTAGFKAGKTTLALNLLRSVADGGLFLGRYPVTAMPEGKRVAWCNYEVDDRQARRWLRDLDVDNPQRVSVLNLRGIRLPLTVPAVEDFMVRWLEERQVEVWIVDPAARAMTGSGDENSNTDVGVWLDTLDVIKDRAGVSELVLPIHTGRAAQEVGQERARGATRFDDWADVRWMLNKDDDGNRYFSASGRDVEVEEDGLVYDAGDRTVRHAGTGDRRKTKDARVREDVLTVITNTPGVSGRDLEGLVRGQASAIRHAVKQLVGERLIVAEAREGRGGGFAYRAAPEGPFGQPPRGWWSDED
jgi:hypothetical protein